MQFLLCTGLKERFEERCGTNANDVHCRKQTRIEQMNLPRVGLGDRLRVLRAELLGVRGWRRRGLLGRRRLSRVIYL